MSDAKLPSYRCAKCGDQRFIVRTGHERGVQVECMRYGCCYTVSAKHVTAAFEAISRKPDAERAP